MKSHVLRVCDVALQLLNHLSVDGYFEYDRAQKSFVRELSRASPQRREEVIKRAITWWRKAQTIPERTYLQDLLKGSDGSAKLDAARRLFELDGSASLPVIRILLTDPDEGVRDGAATLLKEFDRRIGD